MVTKIHRDALLSELASLQALLARTGDDDPLAALSLRQRLEVLQAELREAEGELGTAADVALIFDGGPVRGSSAIDADFAGKALQDYQELVTKQVAAADFGGLAERGRIQRDAHKQARMNITALVHGSFGFVLQEDRADEPEFFPSATRRAVEEISNLLADVSAEDGSNFEARLQEVDARIFQTLRRFVDNLHKASSTLRVAEQTRELKFDLPSVGRAYERLRDSEIEETEETLTGELLGLVPIQRRFEFRDDQTGEVIKGRVAESLSADYLERLDREEVIAGHGWRAVVRTKKVVYPDKRQAALSRMLLDLIPIEGGPLR